MNERVISDALYGYILQQRFEAGENVFRELTRQNIPYAVHKGAVLSKILYGNLTSRISGDIDLLFSRSDSQKIKAIFEGSGFVQGRITDGNIVPYTRAEKIFQSSQSHQLAPYVKMLNNPFCPFVEYDCNLDIFWGESGQHTDMHDFLQYTEEFELLNTVVRKLTPEAEFIALCLHHYKDLNSIYLLWRRGFDVYKLYEIARYLESVSLNVDCLISLCNRYNAGDYVCYCVHYANILYPNNSVKEIEELLSSERGYLLFDCFGLCDEERKKWDVPFIERIANIRKFLDLLLTESDRQKINNNMKMM